MCEAGREELFDELSAWIFSPTLTRHSHLICTQRRFLSDADTAQTCREISALQLDRSINVHFRHFSIDRERRNTVLEGQRRTGCRTAHFRHFLIELFSKP